MHTVLITGVNRGLGLEHVTQWLAKGSHVIGTYRTMSPELQKIKDTNGDKLELYECSMSSVGEIDSLKAKIGDRALDVVICNAGVCGPVAGPLEKISNDFFDFWGKEGFAINILAPLKMASVFYGNLKAGSEKKFVMITSKMGSISDNGSGGSFGYRASKSGLNAVGTSLKHDMPECTVILLHPGWVRTDMGGKNGLIDVQTSVQGQINVIGKTTKEQTGIFIDYKSEVIPW